MSLYNLFSRLQIFIKSRFHRPQRGIIVMQGANVAVTKAKTVKTKTAKSVAVKKTVKVQRKPMQKSAEATTEDLHIASAGASETANLELAAQGQTYTQKELFQDDLIAAEEINATNLDQAVPVETALNQEKSVASRGASTVSSGAIEAKVSSLNLTLSESLVQRLRQKASAEGVAVEEFIAELLSEGLVLRAWEIMERKVALKQPNQNNNSNSRSGGGSPQRFNNSVRGNQGGGNFNGNRPRPQGGGQQNGGQQNGGQQGNRRNNYKNIMEDQGSFMEYVRNQEKRKSP
jgi:predicted DNA binding CopG/RHH family protein